MLSSFLNCCALLSERVSVFWAHVMLLGVPTACDVTWLLPNAWLLLLGLNAAAKLVTVLFIIAFKGVKNY